MQYLDLYQKALESDEVVHVYYNLKWCGGFREGYIPTPEDVLQLVSDTLQYQVPEDSVRNNSFSFDVRKSLLN